MMKYKNIKINKKTKEKTKLPAYFATQESTISEYFLSFFGSSNSSFKSFLKVLTLCKYMGIIKQQTIYKNCIITNVNIIIR